MAPDLQVRIAYRLKYSELVSPGSKRAIYTFDLLRAWEKLRRRLDFPIIIVRGGGYRTPAYNDRIGGSPRSRHLTGEAIDPGVSTFYENGLDPYSKGAFAVFLSSGFHGIGRFENRLHLDVRPDPTFWEYYIDENGRLRNRPDEQAAKWFDQLNQN